MDSVLYNKIQEDIKDSLRNRSSNEDANIKLGVLRMLSADIKYKKIDNRGIDITDADIITVIKKNVKSREDSVSQYTAAGRVELAEKEEKEITILKSYLPEEFTEEEMHALIANVISELQTESVDVSSPKSFGVVMKKTIELASQSSSKLLNTSRLSSMLKQELGK